MLFRSTVATVGVLFAVSVAGGLFIALLGLGEQWQPHKNVAAIVKNGTTYYVDVPDSCFMGAQGETAARGRLGVRPGARPVGVGRGRLLRRRAGRRRRRVGPVVPAPGRALGELRPVVLGIAG